MRRWLWLLAVVVALLKAPLFGCGGDHPLPTLCTTDADCMRADYTCFKSWEGAGKGSCEVKGTPLQPTCVPPVNMDPTTMDLTCPMGYTLSYGPSLTGCFADGAIIPSENKSGFDNPCDPGDHIFTCDNPAKPNCSWCWPAGTHAPVNCKDTGPVQ